MGSAISLPWLRPAWWRARTEIVFFASLHQADRQLAIVWWMLLTLLGVMPAVLAIAMGVLVGAVEGGDALTAPLVLVGGAFVLMQVLAPLHAQVGTNLGDRISDWLNHKLIEATTGPPGMAHLERADLTDDLTLGRDFDLGISGPPMSITMGFIASGLVMIVSGLASTLVLLRYSWWAPLLLGGAWASTHWLLRESSVWEDRNTPEVLEAQRHADYTYRLAVDPPAAKEIRLFGLAGWTVDRFADRRRQLVDLRWAATRLRQRPVVWTLLVILVANGLFFWLLARDVSSGSVALGPAVTYAAAAIGASALAFGGLNWSLSLAAQVVDVVLRLEDEMARAGALTSGARSADGMPAVSVRFRDVGFEYAASSERVIDGLNLEIAAGTSLAIVGQNGAGKTTIAKLLTRLYDPQEGVIEIDGVDLRELEPDAWRGQVAAVFQDFIRFELPLRDNVAPNGADDEVIERALAQAGATGLADLDAPMARGYKGGVEISGGQWQRVALARAVCAVEQGARLVILDEPTAQLDVRGEAEIFERILAATRHCTTILISHRFSTVRHADRICVLEGGRVVELGTHDELIALNGRYRTMFDLQASRFGEEEPDVTTLE